MTKIQDLVKKLHLKSHPEGGFYRETYRSQGEIGELKNLEIDGKRNYSTAIYFLLVKGNFSAWHRIKQDEVWHFYTGNPIRIHLISPSGEYSYFDLGLAFENGQEPQYVVPARYWFASETLGEFSLVGCTVAPGFDFEDFELANSTELTRLFPSHKPLIQKYTRE